MADVYERSRRSGLRGALTDVNYGYLTKACERAGVALGAYDARILNLVRQLGARDLRCARRVDHSRAFIGAGKVGHALSRRECQRGWPVWFAALARKGYLSWLTILGSGLTRRCDLHVRGSRHLNLRTNPGSYSCRVPYVRTVKTSSGATAAQIVYSSHRAAREIEHIGSAHDDAELALLKAAAAAAGYGAGRA